MLDPDIEKAINDQINHEIYSSYLYYSMAAHFESLSLGGFAHWMRVQALEELTHVQKFFHYVSERGGRIIMQAVAAPPSEWDEPVTVFREVYEHECGVTQKINALLDLAISKSDHATCNFLQWFVAEQVEEEASADTVMQQLKMVDKSEGGLFHLDQELNKRTFTMPPEMAGAF